MKKNNKGFTLVELLAALVILGVLSMLALPTVVNLLGNSRDKLYITDAKKLISQAEYKFRVASSEIEKPDDGECLLLSMVYLDNSDFDNPPNNGEYVREASYVVIKNNEGNYEYSVELVEEVKKNVFKGVELSKDSSLSTTSTRHIVSFTKDDLYFVENNTVMGKYSGKQVDTSYINSKLGSSYVSNISKVYNYPDLAESTYNANYSIPKIDRAEFHSASNKDFNSLDTILKVVATDGDTKLEELSVLVGYGHYPDLNAPTCDENESFPFNGTNPVSCKYPFGSLSDFSLKVNFAEAGFDYSGHSTSLYIVVVDPEGNSDRLNRAYTIHTNEAPIIDEDKSGVFKRSNDNINLSTAVLKLNVTDDSTANADLEYCLTEDKDATTCTNGYKKYSDFVNSELSYTFSCADKCTYDGTELFLKVFLRDDDPTKALENTATFSYKLFENDKPQIVGVELISEDLPFVTYDQLALKTEVKLVVNDSSSESNLTVELDEKPDFSSARTFKYSEFSGNVNFTFDGLYDGSEKVLYIRVTDEYGSSSTHNVVYGNVYKNSKPVIENVEFISESLLEKVCPYSKICDKYPARGGAYEVTVKVTASDDLVSEDDLTICISDKAADCTDPESNNFLPYKSGRERYLELKQDTTLRYNGDDKKVYVAVYDGYGVSVDGSYDLSKSTGAEEKKYKIYENHEPEINAQEITITSKDIDYNFRDVNVSFKVNDDLDSINTLKYKLTDDGNGEPVTGTVTATSADEPTVVSYSFGGAYDGKIRTLTIEVEDSYGYKANATSTYDIHGNQAPEVNYVTVETTKDPCEDSVCDNGNGFETNVRLSLKDDLDENIGDIEVCLTTVEGECNTFTKLSSYPNATIEENGEYVLPYKLNVTDEYPFTGKTINVYAYAKDSGGAIGSNSGPYVLYNNNKATVDSDYPIVRSTNYEELTVELEGTGETAVVNKNPNLSTIKFQLKASDEFTSNSNLKYQVCYATDEETLVTATDGITCLENGKFYDYVPDSNQVSTVNLDLGVTSYNGDHFYIFAKVYDEYAYACATGALTCPEGEDYIGYSSQAYYQIYDDVDPEITKFTLTRPSGATSFATLNAVFKVKDPLDTYKYCVSEKGVDENLYIDSEGKLNKEALLAEYEKMCTNYSSTSFDGDEDSVERTFTYNTSWGNGVVDSTRTYLVYLYIKDSHGNITAASTFPERIPCSQTEDDDGTFIDSGTEQESIVYELKPGYEELTAAKCNNKCYYWSSESGNGVSDTEGITSFYNKKVTYVDKDDNSITCSIDEEPDYQVYCNFRTCYYNSSTGNYNVTAIGYMEHENTDGSVTHTENGESHVPSHYRLEYTTSYDEATDTIVLHPTGNKICGQCFDEGKYSDIRVTYDNNESGSAG